MLPSIDLESEFARVIDYWSPKVVARVDDYYLKVAKLKGEFVWHAHEGEDELFLIIKGTLAIQLEDGEECWVVLIERATTKHTGDVITSRTKSIDEQLA